MTTDRSALDISPHPEALVTTMKVVGVPPLTYNAAGNKRPSYQTWIAALDRAAHEAASHMREGDADLYSLRMELRLYAPYDQGSDLDNYVKPIQDALAEHGIFGAVAHEGSPMKGDERVDHLELRRKRVNSEAEAGVTAEVWALD
jgi:Holliday junction resolvase RusA-like endonuclease